MRNLSKNSLLMLCACGACAVLLIRDVKQRLHRPSLYPETAALSPLGSTSHAGQSLAMRLPDTGERSADSYDAANSTAPVANPFADPATQKRQPHYLAAVSEPATSPELPELPTMVEQQPAELPLADDSTILELPADAPLHLQDAQEPTQPIAEVTGDDLSATDVNDVIDTKPAESTHARVDHEADEMTESTAGVDLPPGIELGANEVYVGEGVIPLDEKYREPKVHKTVTRSREPTEPLPLRTDDIGPIRGDEEVAAVNDPDYPTTDYPTTDYPEEFTTAAAPAAGQQQTPAGFNAPVQIPPEVAAQIASMLKEASLLADRRALFTAQQEFHRGMQLVAETLDTQIGQPIHSQALVKALRAMNEADDFAVTGSSADATVKLSGLIVGHRTPALKHRNPQELTALSAMHAYYNYAYQQLVLVGHGDPLASHALFSLGRMHMLMGNSNEQEGDSHGPKALAYMQAAVATDQNNVKAANELGVMLARIGQLERAEIVLVRANQIMPTKVGLKNLALVQQRLGRPAAQQTAAMANHVANYSPSARVPKAEARQGPAVRWVKPQEFNELSGPVDPSIPSPQTKMAAASQAASQMMDQANQANRFNQANQAAAQTMQQPSWKSLNPLNRMNAPQQRAANLAPSQPQRKRIWPFNNPRTATAPSRPSWDF